MDGASGDRPGHDAGYSSRPESTAAMPEASLEGDCAPASPTSCRYASWLEKIEALWRASASGASIRGAVHECLQASDNPYEAALYLVEHCSDFAVKKTSTLACTLAKDVEKWARATAGDAGSRRRDLLTSELLEKAFSVATRNHLLLFDALCGAMDFRSRAADFADRVASLVAAGGDPVGTCQLVTKLGLQRRFGLTAFAITLIAQDRLSVLEQYVDEVPALQFELVTKFDAFCRPGCSLEELQQAWVRNGMKPSGGAHLERRSLAKHGLRLMKKYDVSPDVCPNIVDYHGAMGVRYLMHRHFREGVMSREALCELLTLAARDRRRVCDEVVLQLHKYQETVLAALWARHCRLPSESLPADVAAALSTLPPAGTDKDWSAAACTPTSDLLVKSNRPASSDHYALALPLSEVEMVDTTQAYHAAIDRIIASGGPLAIDCEWAPSFNSALDRPLSIMQLAVSSHVWLFDMLALSACLVPTGWERLKQLFCDPSLIKLGFGFSEDFRKMASLMPGFSSADLVNFVDLAKLYSPPKRERHGGIESKGLADVVRATLGKALDKQEQMSNWERRPLRQAQLLYAAQDAHCLLALYDALRARPSPPNGGACSVAQPPATSGHDRPTLATACVEGRQSPSHEDPDGPGYAVVEAAASAPPIVAETNVECPRSTAVGSRPPVVPQPAMLEEQQQVATAAATDATASWVAAGRWIDPARGSPVDEPREYGLFVTDLHLVVDSMLQGLGRKLRNLGVDTLISGNGDDRDDVASLCLRDGRVLLSAGEPYRRFSQLLPPDRCFAVDHTLSAEAQAEYVLSRFAVRLARSDIFGRCQACNGGHYIDVPAAAMRAMCSQRDTGGSGTDAAAAPPAITNELTAAAASVAAIAAGHTGVACTVVYESACLSTGVPLRLDDVRPGSLAHVDSYRVCATCGKVFWEGLHHRRMAKFYSDRLAR